MNACENTRKDASTNERPPTLPVEPNRNQRLRELIGGDRAADTVCRPSSARDLSPRGHVDPDVTMRGAMDQVRDVVLANLADFVRWPKEGRLVISGVARQAYHAPETYSPEIRAALRSAGHGSPDTRSNGPAVVAYLVAGGDRPWRASGRHRWPIHHIYDGQHGRDGAAVLRAASHPDHFTHSAGLVALHPVAHALADEDEAFAWFLRDEAELRFGYRPTRP